MNMKKVLALALAAVMVMALCGVAFAETAPTATVTTATNKGDGNFTITIGGTYAEDNHTFKAYQIFAGSIGTDGKMGDISWGSGVNTTGIATDLATTALAKKDASNNDLDFSKAADVATALATGSYTSAQLAAIADVFYAHKATVAGSTSTFTSSNNYVITGLNAGYYMVTDEYTDSTAVGEGAATLSRNMLSIVGDVSATVKNSKPDINKQVLSDDATTYAAANEAGIGETVAFKITGTVPNHVGYDYYYYVIQDTLSNGLTFNGVGTIQVKVGDTVLVKDADNGYAVQTGSTAADPTFKIAFKNIQAYTVGAAIEVTYTATVNNNAVTGSTGNPNTVNLIYSNNPNDNSGGTPSTPWPETDSPVGEGPDHKTVTYVAELDLTKYFDSVTAGNELEGATFTLTGTSTDVMGSTTTAFEAAADGTYYKLADGTFTTSVPHGDIYDSNNVLKVTSNLSAYDQTDLTAGTKYKLTSVTSYNSATKNVFMQGTSGANGKIVFKGLGAGTYTITETVTPQGYTTAEPIIFTATVTVPTTISTGSETATWASDNAAVTINGTTGVYETNVIDLSGTVLPSTGGIGTTIFYVSGLIMVLGAAVILVARRRADAE